MKCTVCGNESGNIVFNVREMMFGMDETFTYFQCATCDCLQIAEIPTNIADYYPHDYYSFHLPSPQNRGDWFKNVTKKLRDRYAVLNKGVIGNILYGLYPNETFKQIGRLSPDINSRILDVGCGNGALLYDLKEIGFQNLTGVDLYLDQDIEYPNGLKIERKSIHEVQGIWDLVMLHHAFEHVSDPLETLKSIARLLAENGTVIIRIPTVSSWAWEQYRAHWVQLDAPRHFFLHSTQSINLLAEKSGLFVEDVVYDSTEFQFWGSEQYLKGIPLNDPRSYNQSIRNSIFSKEDVKRFRKKAIELNHDKRGDSAAFFLKKIH